MRRFLESGAARAGLALLAILAVAGVFGPLLVPFAGAERHWHDISFWQDNPAAAPPAWMAGGRAEKAGRLGAGEPLVEAAEGGGRRVTWGFPEKSLLGEGKRDLVLLVPGEGSLPVLVSALGQDGTETELFRRLLAVTEGEPARLPLSVEASSMVVVTEYLQPGRPIPPPPSLAQVGGVSGLLGTDASKRDIFTGIVLGIRWALLLGVAVSFLTVMTGIVLGIAAACYGGWIDSVLNRVYEFLSLMPLLPFLIVLSAVYKPSLWTFAGLALLFFWTRAFKPIYAMALRIREEEYIVAGKSMGTGRLYRAFRYVLPALLPYGFAIMALSVPGIILYEAGISILGLGDSRAVTWGQMLHDALVQGAVINRLWWWILPPGLMIALTGIAFALLGRGFDQAWRPRRRNRVSGAGPSRSRP